MRFLRGACLVLTCAIFARADQDFYLKNGDRVVFYGDSIIVNSGWGSDRVTGGRGGDIDTRLQRDVFAHAPTVLITMLGMNDVINPAFDQGIFGSYVKGYRHIVDTVKARFRNIRMTVIQPSPFDDVTRAPELYGGYNSVLVHFNQFVFELGRARG